jgi:hypothetical protein
MKCKWSCPECEMSSTRRYNVERHIRRIHNGIGEPLNDRNVQYHGEANRYNLRFPLDQFHHAYISPLTRKEKSNQKFSDLLEYQFLQPLRKMAEFKNLLSQLQSSFASTLSSSSNPAYHEVSSSNFGDGFCINNSSNMFEKPFPPDSWITIGFKGRLCESCLTEIYVPVFLSLKERMRYSNHNMNVMMMDFFLVSKKKRFSTLVT